MPPAGCAGVSCRALGSWVLWSPARSMQGQDEGRAANPVNGGEPLQVGVHSVGDAVPEGQGRHLPSLGCRLEARCARRMKLVVSERGHSEPEHLGVERLQFLEGDKPASIIRCTKGYISVRSRDIASERFRPECGN